MKATVEQQYSIIGLPKDVREEKMRQFMTILSTILISDDEEKIRMNTSHVFSFYKAQDMTVYFSYGFGHNHMWVADSYSGDRVILVEF